ncbi:MAG: 2OG-Fe(II) oxygenase [Dokdonella sp.]
MSDDFIELYPDAIAPQVCATLIERFNRSQHKVRGSTGGGIDLALKDSWDITLDDHAEWQDAANLLNTAMLTCFKAYLRKYPYTAIAPMSLRLPDPVSGELKLIGPDDLRTMSDQLLQTLALKLFRPGSINIQKYIADQGGYPYWHCELYPKSNDAPSETLHRTLLWSVYLNDGFVEGETEFLHQHRKVAPRTGAMLIAPAAFTHTHRGNRPKGGDKYIATSWILFQRAERIFSSPPPPANGNKPR